jgi:hypothetical protein
MTKEQMLKGLKYLGVAYNKEFTQEQASVWFDMFKNDDYKIFNQAVKRLISTNQFMPSIAEIKKEMANISTPMLQLDAEAEWETVLNAIRKYGYYQQEKAFNELKEITRSIVKTIGWYRLCSSESIQWLKKEFIEIFNHKQDNKEELVMLGEPTLTLQEIKQRAELKLLEEVK